MNQKETEVFSVMPLKAAIRTLVVPTIISQLILLIYSLGDTWFIGQTGDENQVAAVTLAFPVFMLLSVFASMFGIGGGSLIARLLGKKDPENASRVFTFSITGGAVSAVLLSVAVRAFMPWILDILGADAGTREFTRQYLMYTVVLGGIPSIVGNILGSIIRAKGDAKTASFGLSAGGVMNLILDPLLIFAFHMQVAGAALATALSNVFTLVYFIVYLLRHAQAGAFEIRLIGPMPDRHLIGQVFSIGTPASLQILLASVSNSVMMRLMSSYEAAAVAGLGVAVKIDQIPFYIVQGISGGILPLIAYNYAAQNYRRMQDAISMAFRLGMMISLVGFILIEVFSPQLVRFFIDSAETVGIGAAFLRLRCLAMPVLSVEFLFISVFQGIGNAKAAFVLSILRKGIFDIPLMFLLDYLWPMYGILLVQPIMDIIGFIVALSLYRRTQKEMDRPEWRTAESEA